VGKQTGRSIVNIKELDEESRRTGVWPPRRIVLRVEHDDAVADAPDDGRPAAVKVGEVDLAAPPPAPKPRAVPAPLPARSLSPSVTPSRRPGLPGARGVTPAPSQVELEDEAFTKWLDEPLAIADSDPQYQAPPMWLPDDMRVRAERRHRRVARKGRAQLFGASAATTLAVGGCAAVLALVGISQTETVGGSLGVPSIGLFGTHPTPSPQSTADTAKTATPAPAAKPAHRTRAAHKPAAKRAAKPRRRAARVAPRTQLAQNPARRSTPARTPTRTQVRTPTRTAVNPPAPVRTAPRVSNPPPPPPAPRPTAPPVDSRPTNSAPVAPSRPANSSPSTSSSPAPSSPSLGSDPGL
jgi:hypothetical protein